ncbi:hypothetical protein EJ06DRAFT_374208 [Trichodelitschia bisporula]|uniref:FYVE-type domain-containing protein n=1 Tax=Trichodelitschia bisporula TaxID=703511 RepID=A0A6G1I200_9PEZI|nr:hypothetical protein EJ06DRAFT_374208 [Trichodelitschia bisporula]
MTLLQLNRHIDDAHANLEEIEQDEVKTWFKAQMGKAKKFQPLAVLNQKFKLDLDDAPPQQAAAAEPEEFVTRSHWQRPGYDSACTVGCGRPAATNCRCCGRLFCDEHTQCEMKLSRAARHDPVRGTWSRVCESCYTSREGYNDHRGLERNHTADFVAARRRIVDKNYLEVARLEKRLTKLTQLLAAGGKQRVIEQSVITWEDDASVPKCRFCQQEFAYSFRRHHCRLCGRVVCGDPRTECSQLVGLNIPGGTVDVRMCKDCRHTLFSKADFAKALEHKPPDQRSYDNLAQFERGIRLLLPRFQRLLSSLQDAEKPPSQADIADAQKVRKRLTDAFVQYEGAARRIRDLPTSSPTQARLQKAVYQQATSFLHLHMLPLKALPRILKHASPHGAGKPALASIRLNDLDTGSQASSALESMEAEERELRERLVVLEEQRFIVGEMLADAKKKRRFDEAASLGQNVEDLAAEIDRLNGQLSRLDFAGVYGAIGGPGGA